MHAAGAAVTRRTTARIRTPCRVSPILIARMAAELRAPDGFDRLWTQLESYARDRGWLARVVTDGIAELRFHPEVIVPTRELLRQQPIFAEIQEAPIQFYERNAAATATSESVRNITNAIFHHFQ